MKLFFVDKLGREHSYQGLIDAVREIRLLPQVIRVKSCFEVFSHVVCAAYHGVDVTLLDTDVSDDEILRLAIEPEQLNLTIALPELGVTDINQIIAKIRGNSIWRLSLFTSGTTGLPKKVSHTISSLTRLVRENSRHVDDVWALAYNPTHMAGMQVFFQAFFNQNPLIDVFTLKPVDVFSRLDLYAVTHISATPTYYRLISSSGLSSASIRRVTLGGEKYDSLLAEMILKAFPNGKLRNVYASTEAGSVLESVDDVFTITDFDKYRIESDELMIHQSLMGEMPVFEEWYHTGDIVNVISEDPLRFKFVSRLNEMINVGGYKVNPHEVEEALLSIPEVLFAKVYGKPNTVLGNILMADVVTTASISEKSIRDTLSRQLQPFKIPRLISFVDKIGITRTGKQTRI